jgi:hypothetical protein
MAFEPTSIAAAVFSGLNALIKVTQQTAHFVNTPDEVKQLLVNVELAGDAIHTARRLQRENSVLLEGDHLSDDVDRSVKYTEDILAQLRMTVEDCRRDLQEKKTVRFTNRITWMLWREKEFGATLTTLMNALAALNRDISRLEVAVRAPGPGLPPSYDRAVEGGQKDGGPTFPRAPSKRRPRAERNDLEATPMPDFAAGNQTGAVELEGDEWPVGEAMDTKMRMPPLQHMMSAPGELPQMTEGRWLDGGREPVINLEEDIVTDLPGWTYNDPVQKPRSSRRRSNFI